MATFHCSPLILQEYGRTAAVPAFLNPSPASPFSSWFIQRFDRAGKAHWLFVHGATFYSFTLQREPLENLAGALERFREELGRTLFNQEFRPEEIAFVLRGLEGEDRVEGRISNAMQRSLDVLLEHYRWFDARIEGQGGAGDSVSESVNETPLEMLQHELPAEAFRRLILLGLEGQREAA